MTLEMQRAIIRFKRPTGTQHRPVSDTFREALMLLSEAEELKPLYDRAGTEGKFVSIEVFINRAGEPLLIHLGREEGVTA